MLLSEIFKRLTTTSMFSFLKSQKNKEIQISKCSKKLIILPCVLNVVKNEIDSRTYEMIGYINEGNSFKFMYLERSSNRGKFWVNSIRIPIDIASKLMSRGSFKTEGFSYTFKKL